MLINPSEIVVANTPTPTPKEYSNYLDHFIRQMPGFVAWKTVDSVYASTNLLCAQLAGYKDIESYLGTRDYDWKCDAVEFADDIRKQDQLVLSSNKTWRSFNILKFSNAITYYFSTKSILRDFSGNPLGVLFIGTILDNTSIIQHLTSLANADPKKSEKKIQCNIFSITKEFDSEFDLSYRQQECLFYLLRGKTAKEIGVLLGISNRTVENYIEAIKNKFNCSSRSDLFEKAIGLGYFYKIPESLLEKKGLIVNSYDKSGLFQRA